MPQGSHGRARDIQADIDIGCLGSNISESWHVPPRMKPRNEAGLLGSSDASKATYNMRCMFKQWSRVADVQSLYAYEADYLTMHCLRRSIRCRQSSAETHSHSHPHLHTLFYTSKANQSESDGSNRATYTRSKRARDETSSAEEHV